MTTSTTIIIYHNPACGTSRNTLGLIRNTGIEPMVIEYLINPPSKKVLLELIATSGLTTREALRKNVPPYIQFNLDNPHWTDEQIIDLMVQHPILINRPIVVTELGTRLCRPSEVVLDILPLPQLGKFTKEDGEVVVNKDRQRVK